MVVNGVNPLSQCRGILFPLDCVREKQLGAPFEVVAEHRLGCPFNLQIGHEELFALEFAFGMNLTVGRYDQGPTVLMLQAGIAGREPDSVLRGTRRDHGMVDRHFPVIGSGRVVLRMKNQTRPLPNTLAC